jgi:hypothetical protein
MDILELLIQKVDAEISVIEDSLGSGNAKDYADYQSMCGKIKGLLTARALMKDLQQTMENSDE